VTPPPSRSIPPVPPGSTALREFCHAVLSALSIPNAAEHPGMRLVDHAENAALLCLYRDRTSLVLSTMRRILSDREIDDRDLMLFAVSLREQVASHAFDDDQVEGPL
jgi:hypothetical protein